MELKLFLLVVVILGCSLYLAAGEYRDVGYGISNSLEIYTGGAPNGGPSTAYSNTMLFSTLASQISGGISGTIAINTLIIPFTAFRIVPVSQAPNPAVFHIPKGGFGYAWFRVEGLLNGNWLPATGATVMAVDANDHWIACQSGLFPYQFLNSPRFTDDRGVFAVAIPHTMIGSGEVGASESVFIKIVNGTMLDTAGQIPIMCTVVPYEYENLWGYRLYGKAGVGATAGVVTGTGFFGGGFGSTINCKMNNELPTPDWSLLQISRRADLFCGIDTHVGPPDLINFNQPEAGASLKFSFPYERTYEFERTSMTGMDALMALYLIAEPAVVSYNAPTALFVSCLMEALILADPGDYLNIELVSDEIGIDLEGALSISVPLVNSLPFNLQGTAGLGFNSHIGITGKSYPSGRSEGKFYGMSELDLNLGFRPIWNHGGGASGFYPQKFAGAMDFSFGKTAYEVTTAKQNDAWVSTKYLSKLRNQLSFWNLYNFPSNTEYATWFEVSNTAAHSLLSNTTDLGENLEQSDISGFSATVTNEGPGQEAAAYLNSLKTAQQSGATLTTDYGVDASVTEEMNFGLDLEFPLPNVPGLVLNLGGGIEMTREQKYPIMRGSWVKGYPYLRSEMPNPPIYTPAFSTIVGDIFDELSGPEIYDYMVNVVLTRLASRFLTLIGLRTVQVEILSANGSSIILNENSLPAGADSILFRYWDWGDQTRSDGSSGDKQSQVKAYNQKLRQLREEAIGLQYGIGGFYKFEADADSWGEAPLLTIKYTDAEIEPGYENQLAVYWEDSEGNWQLLPSTCVPDSNLVRAYIPYFATYTLAPRLPNGEVGLSASPDSLLADGQSTAIIQSQNLYNNDGSPVANGTAYTVHIDRGNIIGLDANPLMLGHQVLALGGMITFTVQADSIPLPMKIDVSSAQGFAYGHFDLTQYSTSNLISPMLLSAEPEHKALRLTWQTTNDPEIVGYRIYYDTDYAGPPYTGTSTVYGCNSPVQVGNLSSYILSGLDNSQLYHLAITSVDAFGVESPLSNELVSQPVLRAVADLAIAKSAAGINLSWSQAFGASSYKVYRSELPTSNISQMQYLGETVEPVWLDSTVGAAGKYFYVVISIGY